MTELEIYRNEIDRIDRELADLFCRRMEIVEKIACCKREAGLPVCDPAREVSMRDERSASFARADLLPYYHRFLEELLLLSKQYQTGLEGNKK